MAEVFGFKDRGTAEKLKVIAAAPIDLTSQHRAKLSIPAILAYKATADQSGSEIIVKRVNSDGTVTGDEITLKVLP